MAEERIGTLLGGRYRLESILGSGGTSTVFRAHHTFTNRPVALKLLKPEHARDRGLVARFLKEARAASTVVHPHVVAILDMGTDEDCTFLAMELLHGESLASLLAREGSLSAERAIALLRPLLEAIGVAHANGIVHRDIKPDNVLVGHRGDDVERAVLLDFGMAKTTEATWGHMTQSGVLVGTPYYMSPEQAEGAVDLGPSTDVWSTGVMLYRALSGELPFVGTTPTALLLAIARGEHVPLGERAPHLAPAVAAWVEGALVTDRSRRYPDMAAMLDALDRSLLGAVHVVASDPAQEAAHAAPPMPRSAARFVVPSVVVALVLVGAAWAAQWSLQTDAPPSAPAAPEHPASRAATPMARAELPPSDEPIPSPLVPHPDEPVSAAGSEPGHDEAPAPLPARATTGRPRRASARSADTAASTPSPPARAPESGLVTEW